MKKKIGLVVLVLLLIFVLLIVFRKDNIVEWNTVVEKYETPNSHFFTWENQQYHYTQQGNGGDTIIMIHGLGGNFKNFTDFARILEQDYTIFIIDLPGFGLSEVPNVVNNPPKDMMAYHQGFFDKFEETIQLDSFHIIGNSMGGMVSWYLAAKNPKIKSLTLLNSAGYGMAEVKESATGWMTGSIGKWLFKKGMPLSKAKSNAEACFYDEAKATEVNYTANYYMNNKKGTFQWMLNLATSEILPDTLLIQNINIPTLIVWGENDKVIPPSHANKFKRDIPNAELVIYPNCGHIPQVEIPEKLAADWSIFINQ